MRVSDEYTSECIFVHVCGCDVFPLNLKWLEKPKWARTLMIFGFTSDMEEVKDYYCEISGVLWYTDDEEKRYARIKGFIEVYREDIKDLDKFNKLIKKEKELREKGLGEEADRVLEELSKFIESHEWIVTYDTEVLVPTNGYLEDRTGLMRINVSRLFDGVGRLYFDPKTLELVLTCDLYGGEGYVRIKPKEVKELSSWF